MSSIFGNQNQPQSSGLFGSSTTQNQSQGGGLFGNSTTQNQPQGGGLFGSSTTQNQAPSGGLFGGASNTQTQQNQAPGTSLFGGSTANQNQNQNQTQGGGLFGGAAQNQQNQQNQQQQQSGAQQQQQGSSLFGGANNQQQQPQQQQNTAGTSLFTNSAQQPASNPNGSLFPQQAPTSRSFAERTFNHPQQTHLSSLLQSGLGGNSSAFVGGSLSTASQTDIARSRLQAAGINALPNEKTTVDQVATLVRKWDPVSQDTLMQAYLYNAVNSAYAPFYYRNPDETEKEWEEALSQKPAAIENVAGENVSFVPIVVRGFRALGERIEYQSRSVNEMRNRLHEMNNSLNAVMAQHQQSVTVRLENARRQHAALSQRCLRLAVKAQILRNRGYPLDAAEESLRRSLQGLESQVTDPAIAGREEEIWARMVALRDRARWLEREVERTQQQQEEQNKEGEGGPVSPEVLAKARKILGDYEGQIAHLARELEEVKREFEEWEEGRRH